MENNRIVSAKNRADPISRLAEQRIDDAPEKIGGAIADIQMSAVRRAYKAEFMDGTRRFVREACSTTPEEIGRSAARLRIDGARSAMLGVFWRLPLIGGSVFVGCLYFGFGLSVAAIALVATVPVCCILTAI